MAMNLFGNNSQSVSTDGTTEEQHVKVLKTQYPKQPFMMLNYLYNTVENDSLRKVLGKLGEEDVWAIWHAYKKVTIDKHSQANKSYPTGPEFSKDRYQQSSKSLSNGQKYTISAVDKYIDDIIKAKLTTIMSNATAQKGEQTHTTEIYTTLCKKGTRNTSGNNNKPNNGGFQDLNEKIAKSMQQSAQQQADYQKTMTELQDALKLYEGKVDVNTTSIQTNKDDIEANANDIFQSKERITKLENELDNMKLTSKQQVAFLQSQIDNLSKNTATADTGPTQSAKYPYASRDIRFKRVTGGITTDKEILRNVSIVIGKVPNKDEFNVDWLMNWIRIPNTTLKKADFELLKPTIHTRTEPYPTKSFKVTFQTNLNLEVILDKDNFPQGVLVSRFRYPRKNFTNNANNRYFNAYNNVAPGRSEQSSTATVVPNNASQGRRPGGPGEVTNLE